MRRLCLCLLISLPALLAGPAHTSNVTVPQTALAVDSQPLSAVQIRQQSDSGLITHKTREFANWLTFAPVPDAINLVHGLMDDPELNLVQKEAVLHRLTQHLRSRMPTEADRAVMLELSAYQSQVMTEHHDDPRYLQPAFNIAASAKGTLNEWRFWEIGAELNGDNLIRMWNASGQIDRRHILSSLRANTIDQSRLASIHTTAIQHSATHPDLAALTAMAIGDFDTSLNSAATVSSEIALGMLKTLTPENSPFSEEPSVDLLKAISSHHDPAIAGIALNILAKHYSDPDTISTLIHQLSDTVSGANAALTLSQVLSDTQFQTLQAQTDASDELLLARIRLISQLREDVGE